MHDSYLHHGYRKLSENILFWSRLMAHVDHENDAYRRPVKSTARREGGQPEPAVINQAAEALREVEIEAVDPEPVESVKSVGVDLEAMNIDELRVVAKELDVPEREKITEADELIAAIRKRLGA
jgi:hypothetical protein